MGRYRGGHRKWRRGNKRRKNQYGEDDSTLNDADIENYLLEYRSRAYAAYRARLGKGLRREEREHDQPEIAAPVLIGNHRFLPLTTELCLRPYINLPDSLSGRERRKVHALCASLDLYHAGAWGGDDNGVAVASNGSNKNGHAEIPTLKRVVAISIYANGLEFVSSVGSSRQTDWQRSFPSCRPWYYSVAANGKATETHNDGYSSNRASEKRTQAIEVEKKLIRKFANLPETSLRRNEDGAGHSFCDCLDFGELDSLDLSSAPHPEDTPWMLVDSVAKLKLCADELIYGVGKHDNDDWKIHELAFDLEMHNICEGNSHYQNVGQAGIRTCLIQLTSNVTTQIYDEQSGESREVCKDYIVDPLAPGVWAAIPTYLGPLFSNPNIVKIGHGIGGMDVSSLHRDFGILVVNAFDTYEASAILTPGRNGLGLAALCRHYKLPNWEHYKELKHKYQNSDWRLRPLDDDALLYGRYDVRFLVTLKKLLCRDLAKLDMLGGSKMKRFGSSLDDDSGLEQSFDSQPGSAISSKESSISERESAESSENSTRLDQVGDAKDCSTAKENGPFDDSSFNIGSAPSRPQSSYKPMIEASEFPCYHHLMQAISLSQKRCLKLWTGEDSEPILKNPSLLSMIKQAAKQKGYGANWSDDHMDLYKKLAKWRETTAQRQCDSMSSICSLDFLVHVAYKLPVSKYELRRHSYFLPALLEDESLPYCDELLELVTSSGVFRRQGLQPSSELKRMEVVFFEAADDSGDKQSQRKQLLKFLLASTVVGALFLTVARVRRR
ncbi:hypothetical protein ACHAWF_014804 [Thalassiosira exigua]